MPTCLSCRIEQLIKKMKKTPCFWGKYLQVNCFQFWCFCRDTKKKLILELPDVRYLVLFLLAWLWLRLLFVVLLCYATELFLDLLLFRCLE